MATQLFKISQSAVVQNGKGEVLILRHATGNWLLPGGKINTAETSLDGLKREIKEETGINNFTIKKIVEVEAWSEGEEGKCVVTYLLEPIGEVEVVLSSEHDKFEWVSPEGLDKYQFWHPSILERIKKALEM